MGFCSDFKTVSCDLYSIKPNLRVSHTLGVSKDYSKSGKVRLMNNQSKVTGIPYNIA